MSKQPSEFKRYKAYRSQRDGRRNGSIAVAFALGVLLLAFAPVLSAYSVWHHRTISAIFDPIIFAVFGYILLRWVYTPESAWAEKFPPRPVLHELSAEESVEFEAQKARLLAAM